MQILSNVNLKSWHTLQAPAQARELTIIEAQSELSSLHQDVFILGGGSNVVFVGEVCRPLAHLRLLGHDVVSEDKEYIYYYAAAGEKWNDIAQVTAQAGWYGLENLALIPGTIGAAPVQNIGAYGVEVAEVIEKVHLYDRLSAAQLTLTADQCGFAYRQSYFKGKWRNRYIITGATFRLRKQARPKLNYPDLAKTLTENASPIEIYQRVCHIREQKLPDPAILPNAGSFFHNPIVSQMQAQALSERYPTMPQYIQSTGEYKLSAGWCIEQCGFKGYFDGAVGMYEKHALVLVNRGGRGEEILAFAAKIQMAVYAQLGVTLNIEPSIIGEQYGGY